MTVALQSYPARLVRHGCAVSAAGDGMTGESCTVDG